jgi:hypothetical protein
MTIGGRFHALLAAAPDFSELARSASSGPDSTGTVAIVLMAILLVVLLVVLWAVFFRRPARSPERGRLIAGPAAASEGSGSDGRRRRRKKARRGRNATLAETGGLPEQKSGEQGRTSL